MLITESEAFPVGMPKKARDDLWGYITSENCPLAFLGGWLYLTYRKRRALKEARTFIMIGHIVNHLYRFRVKYARFLAGIALCISICNFNI